jgi:nucleoid DNA-binding protein
MAKIKYKACENKKTGTHSFFAQPIYSGTLTMKELCKEAFDGKAIEESTAKAAIEEFMKTVQRNLLKGFRCQIGEDFLTVYPNLQLSVKDKQENGQTVVATADMLKANNAISRPGCTVHPKYSKEFAQGVQWQKVDGNGTPVEEADITQGNENISGGESPSVGNLEPTQGDQTGGGSNGSGSGGNDYAGDMN